MTVRVNWPHIMDTIEASGYDPREPFLFILPHAGRHLLLAIADRLEWQASFRDFGYNFADWDELQDIVAETHHGLMEMEQVNLIVAKLEEIRQELELMRQATQDTSEFDALDAIGVAVTAIDPRLGVLLEAVNAIEDLMGGSWNPPGGTN